MARTSRLLAPIMVLALLLSAVAVVLPAQQVFAADEEWEIVIPFTTSSSLGEHADLTFGCKVGATDGFDGFDTTFPNPFDPTAPYAAFTYAPGSYLKKDFRAPVGASAGSTRQWSLYTFSPTGTTKTLTWGDVAGILPLDVTLTMTGSGQPINMRTQSSVNLPAGTHTLTITLTRLAAPSTVWVDDDYSGIDGTYEGMVGNTVLIYGYNAFQDIQPGINAVSGSTVYVFPGEYTFFTISNNNVRVLGIDGTPEVFGGCIINSPNATGIVVDNLMIHGPVQCHSNDTHDVTLSNLEVSYVEITPESSDFEVGGAPSVGIEVITGIPNATVYIDNCYIYGVATGIYVENDSAVITNTWIESCSDNGIHAKSNANVSVSNSLIDDCKYGVFADDSSVTMSGTEILGGVTGVYLGGTSQATATGCCSIHGNSQYGFYVSYNSRLTATGNNIFGNGSMGVYWDRTYYEDEVEPLNCKNNWWGDDAGPIVDNNSVFPRDGISLGVLYSPWLDKACPNGKPVGINAAFKGVARSGEPGLKVTFTDLSTPAPGCEIIEWKWSFGDGSTSTEKNPFHIYNREGTFTVTLTVWDSCGFEQTVTMKAYITIKKPTASTTVEPAKLGVSYLNIDPAQVLPNQEVTISANICNSGEERGTKTVSLMVNGEAVASQSVGVSGGSCQQVVFKTSRAIPGTYQVAIDGMTGEFSVLAPRTVTRDIPSQQQTGLGTAGIIAIIAVLLVLIAALIMVFKRD